MSLRRRPPGALGMAARPHGQGIDVEVEEALRVYMEEIAPFQWRSRSDLRAAVEGMLAQRFEIDEVSRVLRAWSAAGVTEDRLVSLSAIDEQLQRREWRLRPGGLLP